MDDIITNAQKIEAMIEEIETLVDNIPEAAEAKALGISNYDRQLALTIVKIKNGQITQMEDSNGELIDITSLPATLIRDVAKGIIWKAAYDKESGDAGYKGIITMVDARKAQLNGLQSVNKVLQ